MSRRTGRGQLNLGRPEEFAKTGLWRLYGGTLPAKARRRRKAFDDKPLAQRISSFMKNVLAKHW